MTGEKAPRFVLHEHAARHHHFDLRLEHDGVLASWAVPKGMPEAPGQRRLAIETEDHSLSYIDFTGSIPEGEYGAGGVTIADSGWHDTVIWEKDRIEVILHGTVYVGKFVLLRFKKAGGKDWLIIRARD
jgi:bifunctional non-homologous end joining protein LigD